MKKPEEMLLDAELEQTINKMSELQKQIDHLLKATDSYIIDEPLKIQFFVRVNSGRLVETFSELAKQLFSHVEQTKMAVSEHQKMVEAAKKVAVPEGQNNE